MNKNFSPLESIQPHWRYVAGLSEEDIREALVPGYKTGKPFTSHYYHFFHPGAQALRVLDFGCGLGRNFPSIRSVSKEIVAYDIPDMIAACRKYADYTAVSLTDDWNEVKSQRFDVAILTLVIQHLEDGEALNRLLLDVSNCSDYVYISSRCWIDGPEKPGAFDTLMATGFFDFCGSNLPYSEILSSGYPDNVHYDLLLRSRSYDSVDTRNDGLFDNLSFAESSCANVRGTSLMKVLRSIPARAHDISDFNTSNQGPEMAAVSFSELLGDVLEKLDRPDIDWIMVSGNRQSSWCFDVGYRVLSGEYQNANLIFPAMASSPVYDSYFLRNSMWTRGLLKEMKSYTANLSRRVESGSPDFEQVVFREFFNANRCDISANSLIVERRHTRSFRSSILDADGVTDTSPLRAPSNSTASSYTNGKYAARTIWAFYTCEKNNDKRLLQQHWLREASRDPDSLILFFYGREVNRKRVLGENEIELPLDEAYENLGKKTFQMFKWIEENCDYRQVIKIDDDVAVLDYTRLKERYSTADYVGFMVKSSSANVLFNVYSDCDEGQTSVPTHYIPYYYAQGGCYGLSWRAIRTLLANEESLSELEQALSFEDCMIGKIMLGAHSSELSIRHDYCFAPTPQGNSKRWAAVGDLSVRDLKQVYEQSSLPHEESCQKIEAAWKARQSKIWEERYQRDYELAKSRYPLLDKLEDLASREVAALGRTIDVYKEYEFRSVFFYSGKRQDAPGSILSDMGIDLRLFTDMKQLRSITHKGRLPVFLVVDSSVNIQACAIELAELLISLPTDSVILFHDVDSTKIAAIFSLEMARSGEFDVHKIGLCLLFKRLAMDRPDPWARIFLHRLYLKLRLNRIFGTAK